MNDVPVSSPMRNIQLDLMRNWKSLWKTLPAKFAVVAAETHEFTDVEYYAFQFATNFARLLTAATLMTCQFPLLLAEWCATQFATNFAKIFTETTLMTWDAYNI